ncbi:11286_t:CDS:2 [Funneliformis geosporum]|nr:11286_t:CDS:2 [Funneliformis geosporum]
MDETTFEGFSKAIQKPTVWTRGHLPTDTNRNVLGRNLPPLHTLYQPPYQESVSREAGDISYSKVGTSAQLDKEEGIEENISSIHDKSVIFDSKQQIDEIYDLGVSSINAKTASNNTSNGSQRFTKGSSNFEGGTDANIQMGEFCPNREHFKKTYPSFGQLLRIYPMGSVARTECKFVHPHDKSKECESRESMLQMSKGDGIDAFLSVNKNSRKSPMVIEKITQETDRQQIATMLRLEFDKKSKVDCYDLEEILEFGFTHVIFVGFHEYEPVFFDCYGRIFKMDDMTGVLWKLGNSLEEAAMNPLSQIPAWIVEEDGTIDDSEFGKPKKTESRQNPEECP